MQERELIRLRKEAGQPRPWTEDPILHEFKFTNVKRAHDRTSRELAKDFYPLFFWDPEHLDRKDLENLLLNCAIARYFGTSEFAISLGFQNGWDPEYVIQHAQERMLNRQRVFTGAYVITNGGISAPKEEVVVTHYLDALFEKLEHLVETIIETDSWEAVGNEMMQINGFGGSGFMTKEVLLDFIMISGWEPADWQTWTPAGPGARRGIARLHGYDDINAPEARRIQRDTKGVIADMQTLYNARHEHWPATSVRLDLTDIQFQLCEFDKYERVRLGQGKPRSKYK